MTIKGLSEAVHQNAVNHGWWEEDRDFASLIALVHSEWSEALEEARAGRPLIYKLVASVTGLRMIQPADPQYTRSDEKPEGVATELIDGCIRVLDVFGRYEVRVRDAESAKDATFESLYSDPSTTESVPEDIPHLVAVLHATTSQALVHSLVNDSEEGQLESCELLTHTMVIALTWIKLHGIDPLQLLLEKHKYNITRPYKHGKKF